MREWEAGDEGMEMLARHYQRALTRAPTRPHPRCPRSGTRGMIALWLHGRWDRVLDTMDSRAGVGRDFVTLLAPSSSGGAGSSCAEEAGEGRRAWPEGPG